MLPEFDTILCAIDMSAGSNEVLEHGIALGRSLGAKIHVVFAVEPVNQTGRTMIANVLGNSELVHHEREVARSLEQQLHRHLSDFAKHLLAGGAPDDVFEAWHVAHGRPGPTIRSEAKRVGAGLLVIGMRGHSAFEHLLIGSVARYLSQHSEVPLVLVPIRSASWD